MNLQSYLPIVYLVVGVVLLSVIVSTSMVMLYGPKKTERTIVVERPGWWGHYGSGLPGWGGSRAPPPPSPHPKPPKPIPHPPPSPPHA